MAPRRATAVGDDVEVGEVEALAGEGAVEAGLAGGEVGGRVVGGGPQPGSQSWSL